MVDEIMVGPMRPPTETFSLLLRVTMNCPWRKCAFCWGFKDEKFSIREVEDVKADIRAAKSKVDAIRTWAEQLGQPERVADIAKVNGIFWLENDGVKNVFMQDSDTLTMKTDQLIEIVKYLKETFPSLEHICSYARAKTLVRKTPEELRSLREAGLNRVYVGLETGDDELLALIQKGATSEEMVTGGRKAVDAGFELSMYVMPGLGGREKWEQNALNTARVINATNPHHIRLRTLHLMKDTPLYEWAEKGEFHVQTVQEVLTELRLFIASLENITSEIVSSDYTYNYYMGILDGKLPDDKPRMLRTIVKAMERWHIFGEPKRSPFLGGLARANV